MIQVPASPTHSAVMRLNRITSPSTITAVTVVNKGAVKLIAETLASGIMMSAKKTAS